MAKKKAKATDDSLRWKITWVILKSGECVLGTQGGSFGAFNSAGGAAWTLRKYADAIEKDGIAHSAGAEPK